MRHWKIHTCLLVLLSQVISGVFSQDFNFIPQKGHRDSIDSLQYSPDGERLMSLGYLDNKLTLWDIRTGKEYASIVDRGNRIGSAVITPDGKTIVAARRGKKVIEVLDFSTLKPLREFSGSGMFIDKVMVGGDSRHCLAFFSEYGAPNDYKFIDLETGLALYTGKTAETIVASAISPNGKFFALSDYSGGVYLHDLATGNVLGSHKLTNGYITTFCFAPDGKYLGGGTSKGEFCLWTSSPFAEPRRVAAHSSGIRSCEYTPDGQRIVLGGEGSSIATLDAVTLAPVYEIKKPEWVVALAVSPAGDTAAYGDRLGSIALIDANTGSERKTLGGQGGNVKNAIFNPNRNELVFDNYNTIRTLSIDSLSSSKVAMVKASSYSDFFSSKSRNKSNIQEMAFSKDGKYLATNSIDEYEIRLFDGSSYQQIGTLGYNNSLVHETFTFMPDGSALVCGVKDRKTEKIDLYFYELPGLKKIRTIPTTITPSYGIEKIIVSSDQRKIVALGQSDSLMPVFIWDLQSGTPVALPDQKSWKQVWELGKGFAMYPISTCAAFTKDGSILAVGDTHGFVRLYNTTSGAQTWATHIFPDSGTIKTIKYDPSGKHLIAAGTGADIVILNPETGEIERRLKGHSDSVNSLDFSSNGSILVSASDDAFIKLWNLSSGVENLSLIASGPDDWLVFSNDGVPRQLS